MMKQKKLLVLLLALVSVVCMTIAVACGGHTHHLSKVDGTPATCEQDGVADYYKCDGCDKLFADADGKEEITAPQTVTAHHTPTKVDGVAPTCETTGTKEYYECEVCHKKFSDSACRTEISSPEILPAAHDLVKENRVEPTCSTPGTEEYYRCLKCTKLFSDKDGQNPITEPQKINTVDHKAKIDHTTLHLKAKTDGKSFGDYEAYGKCVWCGEDAKISDDLLIPYLPSDNGNRNASSWSTEKIARRFIPAEHKTEPETGAVYTEFTYSNPPKDYDGEEQTGWGGETTPNYDRGSVGKFDSGDYPLYTSSVKYHAGQDRYILMIVHNPNAVAITFYWKMSYGDAFYGRTDGGTITEKEEITVQPDEWKTFLVDLKFPSRTENDCAAYIAVDWHTLQSDAKLQFFGYVYEDKAVSSISAEYIGAKDYQVDDKIDLNDIAITANYGGTNGDMIGKFPASRAKVTIGGQEIDENYTFTQTGEITLDILFGGKTCQVKLNIADKAKAHSHNLTKVDGTPSTCTQAGTLDHYKCDKSDCDDYGKLYADVDGLQPIEEAPAAPLAPHTIKPGTTQMVLKDGKEEATAFSDYEVEADCSVCNQKFTLTDEQLIPFTPSDNGNKNVGGNETKWDSGIETWRALPAEHEQEESGIVYTTFTWYKTPKNYNGEDRPAWDDNNLDRGVVPQYDSGEYPLINVNIPYSKGQHRYLVMAVYNPSDEDVEFYYKISNGDKVYGTPDGSATTNPYNMTVKAGGWLTFGIDLCFTGVQANRANCYIGVNFKKMTGESVDLSFFGYMIVDKDCSGISAAKTQKTYEVGSTLDLSDLVVTASYGSGAYDLREKLGADQVKITIDGQEVTGEYKLETEGTVTLTIEFMGKTTTLDITVTAAAA